MPAYIGFFFLSIIADIICINTSCDAAYGNTNRPVVISTNQLPDFQEMVAAAESSIILMKGTVDKCPIP